MNKKDIIAVVVVLVVVLFLTEPFYTPYLTGTLNGPRQKAGSNVSGTAVFNGTIRTYDPFIVIPINTSQSIVDTLKRRSDVRDVKSDPQGYVVQTDTRDDVYTLSVYLRSINVTGYSVANIAATDQIPVDTALGRINATINGGAVRVVTEPLLDSDSPVTVSLIAIVQDGEVIDYRSASLLLQKVELQLDTTVQNLNYKVYSYSIPWESRNSLPNLTSFGTVNYKKVDSIVFKPPLTLSQTMAKKQFSYVTFIDTSSAQVESSFSNVSQIQVNFADTPYILPPSSLVITTNQTPDLAFNSSVSYSYTLVLLENQTNYVFPQGTFFIESDRELDQNSTIKLNISATALGDKIIDVRRVALPS